MSLNGFMSIAFANSRTIIGGFTCNVLPSGLPACAEAFASDAVFAAVVGTVVVATGGTIGAGRRTIEMLGSFTLGAFEVEGVGMGGTAGAGRDAEAAGGTIGAGRDGVCGIEIAGAALGAFTGASGAAFCAGIG